MLWLYGNYNAQGAFVIIFFICRDFLNYVRSLCSHYLTYLTDNYIYNCMKIIITKEISIFTCHFEESYAELLGPPQKFQVNIKIQLNTVRVSRLSFRFLWLWCNKASITDQNLHKINQIIQTTRLYYDVFLLILVLNQSYNQTHIAN